MNKAAELIGVYGMRGAGKTTRVRALIADRKRVLVFDPTGEYGREHRLSTAESGAALRRQVARHWHRGFRIAFVPRSGSEPEYLHALATFALACQAPYLNGKSLDQLTLVVEEMNLGFPAQGLPRQLDGMARICNQGRHWGIEVIGVTQRPAMVSTMFRGNTADTWIYRLALVDDRKAVMAMIGREHEAALAQLAPHQFLRYRDGHVERGSNPPPKGRRA